MNFVHGNLQDYNSCMPNQWKMLQKMSHTVVRQCAQHPPANDFADMLENIFHGHPGIPTRPLQLTEPNWSLQELKGAIERMKANKASDECGLVAELLHFAPENVVTALLGIMNQILHTGQVPSSWQNTMFQMLPKTKNARTTKDFHPIANIRLMYKTFAYLILGRIEEPLEHAQPEEQHGFRTKRRIEEHLLSANMVIDKTLLANAVLTCLTTLLDTANVPATTVALAHLPLHLGGLGLTSVTVTAAPAYWASWADTIPMGGPFQVPGKMGSRRRAGQKKRFLFIGERAV